MINFKSHLRKCFQLERGLKYEYVVKQIELFSDIRIYIPQLHCRSYRHFATKIPRNIQRQIEEQREICRYQGGHKYEVDLKIVSSMFRTSKLVVTNTAKLVVTNTGAVMFTKTYSCRNRVSWHSWDVPMSVNRRCIIPCFLEHAYLRMYSIKIRIHWCLTWPELPGMLQWLTLHFFIIQTHYSLY